MLTASPPVAAQALLDGEFGDIDLGREVLEPGRFPTLQELRAAVKEPEIRPVLLLKLWSGPDNSHLPIWSFDGQRLAFQQTRIGESSSKLWWFSSLAQPEPKLLSNEAGGYEYMFRWGVNSEWGYVFARIEASNTTRLIYSSDGATQATRTPEAGHFFHPALYERTDGIRWLAFERDGEIVHQAWSGEETVERVVGRGTSPRWSRDGKQLLIAGEMRRAGDLAEHRIVLRHLARQTEVVLSERRGVVVRSPVFSPDDSRVTFYERDAGDGRPWRIQICATTGEAKPVTLVSDVVVNPDFSSEGPSWEPGGERIWCFSHAHRQEEYYPMVAADVTTGRVTLVDYPRRANSPQDLAVNPVSRIPEIAFAGHTGTTRDLFVVFMNHY